MKSIFLLLSIVIFIFSGCKDDANSENNTTNPPPPIQDKTSWLNKYGTDQYDSSKAIVLDSKNSIYIAGKTAGNLHNNTNRGKLDIFLSKFSNDGKHTWTLLYGTEEDEWANALAIDNDNSIFVAGTTYGKLDDNENFGAYDIFLTKFFSNTQKAWTIQYGTDECNMAQSLVVDNIGNIYIAGKTRGDLEGEINNGQTDGFLTKVLTDGTKKWTTLLGTEDWDVIYASAIDNDNNIYLTGYTKGNLEDEDSLVGEEDIFLAKYSSNGEKIWIKQFGTIKTDIANAISINTNGDIYIAGETKGNLGDSNITNAGGSDLFVTKFTSGGERVWTKTFGTIKDEFANAISVKDDIVFVAGSTQGDFDNNTSLGGKDIFLVKFSSVGDRLDTKTFGTSLHDSANAIFTDKDNMTYITGYIDGYLDDENKSINNIFILKTE